MLPWLLPSACQFHESQSCYCWLCVLSARDYGKMQSSFGPTFWGMFICSSGVTVNCKFFFLEDSMGRFLFSLLQVWIRHKGAVTLCSEPLTYLLNWCPGDCAVALSCAWVISRSWQCHTWTWPHYLFGTIFFLCTSKQGIWHSLHSSVFIIINY